MDDEEKEKIEREEMYKEKIEHWEESKARISKELEGKEGREREAVENRMASCDRLIKDYQERLNPTGKKEMYK